MNRHTIALVGAALAMLFSAAALATAAGDAPTTIEACRNTRHGLVRIVFSAWHRRRLTRIDAFLIGRQLAALVRVWRLGQVLVGLGVWLGRIAHFGHLCRQLLQIALPPLMWQSH